MQRNHQAPEDAAAGQASTTAASQQSLGRRGPVAGTLRNVSVPSARPLPAGSPSGFRDSRKERLRQVTPDRAELRTGRTVVPLANQGRQPFTIIQPVEITSRQGSELPKHIKPCVPMAEHKHSGLMQARPLPPHVGSAVIKPASEHCRQQFDVPSPMNTPSPSSRIPRMSRTCSTARTQQQVGHCSETQHSSPSVGSSLPCGRLGDRAYEHQEAAATCAAATTDASQATACSPQKSILPSAGYDYGDTSLSASSSCSPLKPFELNFRSPDLERFKDPFKDCPGVSISSDISQYADSSPEFTPPPVTTTTDAIMNVAIPLPDSPAHYTDAPEPRRSAEHFNLPFSVTLRRRRATKNMSPLALSELSPIHPTERVEPNPEEATEDELEESDADEGPWNSASYSGQALAVPKFTSPDMREYGRRVREEFAKCYDVHRESPSSLMDSPASTVSTASAEHNVASSPPAAIPVESKSTLEKHFARSSLSRKPSPISRPLLHVPHRLSTVMECTETSIKGSTTTAHWPAHGEIEESLIVNTRQPTLVDGNFSAASPSLSVCLEEEAEPTSDSLASFMRHEQSFMRATEDDADTQKSSS
ncbi:uncharacterized protein LOC119461625 isoform X3 [Dermacentor silvarum]|uniref:uncharacterized protein LOC119461625 isoform X3 n=1 Tax=Dermacentor silvarum TaxID=543639 RepID=UPI002100728E|nr:uncharacterized protein LOC119461625 isoform X3 [Dermacentor silvarum]